MSIKVLTIAEQKDGKLSNVSYELLTVAAATGGEVITACLAESADGPAAEPVASRRQMASGRRRGRGRAERTRS